jgi:uncharacterized RDD family membrane protein YckC
MASKKCPRCGLYNDEAALRCDCGHDFASGLVQASYLGPAAAVPAIAGQPFSRRAGAYLVDVIVLYAVSFALSFISGFLLAFGVALLGQEPSFSEQALSLPSLILGFVQQLIYFAAFEALYGASPGKLLLRLRVVQTDGQPCGLRAALVRGLMRYVDALFFAIPAYLSMKPPAYQRLGDKAARTIVAASRDPGLQALRSPWGLALAAVIVLAALFIGYTIVFTIALQ